MQREKTVNDDRITYTRLRQLTDGRDRPAARAVENAARGVNAAEQAIRQNAAMIRAKLGEIEQRLDHGLALNDLGELQRMPADLDRAVTLAAQSGSRIASIHQALALFNATPQKLSS